MAGITISHRVIDMKLKMLESFSTQFGMKVEAV
jgi:hypothetical protein